MSTYIAQYPRAPTHLVPFLAFLLLLAVGVGGVTLGVHALKHPESAAIRQCLNDKGEIQIFRSFDAERFYRVCEINPGKFGFQTVDKDGNEITAFSRLTGAWKDTINYLSRFGTRYKGPVPWMKP